MHHNIVTRRLMCLLVVVALLLVASVAAAQTVDVTPQDPGDWIIYTETFGDDPLTYVNNEGLNTRIDATGDKTYAAFGAAPLPLTQITQMSVTTNQKQGPRNWYVDVFIDPECDGTGVLELEYDFTVPANRGSTTVDMVATAEWRKSGFGSALNWNQVVAEVTSDYPDACLDAFPFDDAFNAPILWQVGDKAGGWVGYRGALDSFSLNGTTYDFTQGRAGRGR